MVARDSVPDVSNFSCWSATFQHPTVPSATDIAKAVCSSLLGVIVVIANSIFIVVLNGRRYAKHLTFQPRYLLTSMAFADLLKGLLAVPLSVYPTLYHCWPYPAILCGVQALLMPLLHHQAALTLSLLALDRYCCLLHPSSYQYRASRPLCLLLVLLAWIAVAAFHVSLYLPTPQFFYFNHYGSQSCEPFQTTNSKIIMVACAVYFPTTMITMYSYGTVFHVARTSVHRLVCATVSAPEILGGPAVEKLLMSERRESLRACRVMAVVSLSFVITITPWTLRQIIAACTNSRIPGGLDYGVWIVNIFGGTVIIFIYWLLSPAFRRALEETLHNRVCCGNVYYERGDDVTMVHLPPPPQQPPQQPPPPPPHLKKDPHHCHHFVPAPTNKIDNFRLNNGGHAADCPAVPLPRINPTSRKRAATQSCNTTPRHLANGRAVGAGAGAAAMTGHHNGAYDIDVLGEKYWGEILERTVSSMSLQNLQRIYRNESTSHPELRLSHGSNWHI